MTFRLMLSATLVAATLVGAAATSASAMDTFDDAGAMPFGARPFAQTKCASGEAPCSDLFGDPLISARKRCSIVH